MGKEKLNKMHIVNWENNSKNERVVQESADKILLNFIWEVPELIKDVLKNVVPTLEYNKVNMKQIAWYTQLSVYIEDKNWENNEILFVTDKDSKTKNMKIYPQDHIRDYYYELKNDAKKSPLNTIFKHVELFLQTGQMPDILEKKSLDLSDYR